MIEPFECKYALVSKELRFFQARFFQKYNLQEYRFDDVEATAVIMFGFYSKEDYHTIMKLIHSGKTVYMVWGGMDCHTKCHFKKIPARLDIIHVAISLTIQRVLKENNIDCIFWKSFSLLDETLFQPQKSLQVNPTHVYIYNGLFGKSYRELFFRKDIYDKVMKDLIEKYKFTKEQFILSNSLHESYESMPEIYSKCFIGLRLCDKDGNANTVQEFESLKIPIIHNCSRYGIKWSSTEDIIEIILANRQNVSKSR